MVIVAVLLHAKMWCMSAGCMMMMVCFFLNIMKIIYQYEIIIIYI